MKPIVATLNISRTFFALAMAGALLIAGAGTAMAGGSQSKASMDIVDTAAAAGQFNTLITAVKAAGLEETLRGEGPLTVFAPTDEAFAKIPKPELDALLNDKEALTKVLTYHVVSGKLEAADIAGLEQAQTVEGAALDVSDSDSGVRVNDANVIQADIPASNGVIHVIDEVLMPR